MSRYHYIASNIELPLGERGSKRSIKTYSEVRASKEIMDKAQEQLERYGMVPLEDIIDLSHLKNDDCIVFDTEEDAAGIYIQNIEHWNEGIRKQFKNQFVYRISANWGGFYLNPKLKKDFPESYKANLKCFHELFKLMNDFGNEGQEFELYTCWTDEESEKKNKKLDMIIDLKSFEIGENFKLQEKQYIVVKI